MEINLWLILFQAVPFVAALFFLSRIIFRPTLAFLAERERQVQGLKQEAEQLNEEAGAEESRVEETLAQARNQAELERQEILANGRQEEEAVAQRARAEAEARIRAGTAAVLEDEAQANRELERDAQALAGRVASRVLGRDLALLVVAGLVLSGAAWASGGEEPGSPWKWVALHAVNFLIFAAILYRALRRPLADYLAGRKAQVRDGLDGARRLDGEARTRRQAAQARTAGLSAEIEDLRARAREAATAERQGHMRQAETAAQAVLDTAARLVADEKTKARHRVRARVAERALALARERVRAEIRDEDEQRLWEQNMESLETGP